jgi:hypothetical protein
MPYRWDSLIGFNFWNNGDNSMKMKQPKHLSAVSILVTLFFLAAMGELILEVRYLKGMLRDLSERFETVTKKQVQINNIITRNFRSITAITDRKH